MKSLFKFSEDSDKKAMTALRFYVSVLFILLFALSGCSLEASLSDINSVVEKPIEDLNRKEPDVIFGETVTTSAGTPGFQVRAVIGEISEKQSATAVGGWQVEGTFYE